MATTDIDGTPLLMFGATEVVTLLGFLEDIQLRNDEWAMNDAALSAKIVKIKKFLAKPEVVKWLEENV